MRQAIIERQVKAMALHGLDAMIACSPENFAYGTGFVVPSQSLMRHRHAMTIVLASGAVALFGVDMEATTINRREPNAPTRIWAEFSDDPMQVLASQIDELDLARGRIGIELDYLSAADFHRLARALPNVKFEPCEQIFAKLRQIKTVDEIALLRRLSRIADRAIYDALRGVKAGDSEMDLAVVLTRRVYEMGAQQFKLMIVATGERSQLPNVGPSERRLQPGDVCRVEIFPIIDGYHAGVCRTAIVQKAPPMAEKIWQHLVDCKYIIMKMVKPGADCRTIYDAFLAKLQEMKLPPISFVGHGIGLHLHEDPYLGVTPILGRPGETAKLETGMVLGFEPLCYQTGYGFGMQNKDMLLVTENGSELLSDVTNTDRLVVVD